jgi:hypothetical protein
MTDRTIWRFDFPVTDRVTVAMPEGTVILKGVGTRGPELSVWGEVDKARPWANRTLRVVGTGNPFDARGHVHVGSIVVDPFVWHVYEEVA